MLAQVRACCWLLILSVLICCIVYPLALLVVGQVIFPSQANGGLIYDQDGQAIGSRLIAQEFKGDEYFWARPSAVSYNAAASGASNYGANNPALRERVARSVAVLTAANGLKPGQEVPADLVMASGSGLDPHITLEAALFQLDRVTTKWAELTKRDKAVVRQDIEKLLNRHRTAPLAGLAGVSLVNVLEMNVDLRKTLQVQ